VTTQDLKKFGRDEDETPAPRVHASDENGDVKSLDRKGQRNLYLLIQQKTDGAAVWKFPGTAVVDNELLHEVREPVSFLLSFLTTSSLVCGA
jgi:large subunit ribosomal protein L46